jgi:hypothetical protein
MLMYSVAPAHVGPSGGYRPTSDADLGACLVRGFDAATAHRSEETMATLRAAAVDLVGRLKARGLPSERVVVVLKSLVRGHGPAGWVPSLCAEEETPWARREATVYARLFGWCVQAYYADVRPGSDAPVHPTRRSDEVR